MSATNIVPVADARLDRVLRALAHPGRRALVAQLRREAAPVGVLAQRLGMSLPTMSKHLKALEKAGFVTRRVEGRSHHCALDPEPLRDLAEWLSAYRSFWDGQLEALARHLDAAADE
jgi:DNA-binding transcriptional ArsR family regulator